MDVKAFIGIFLLGIGILELLICWDSWIPRESDHPNKKSSRIMLGIGIVFVIVGIILIFLKTDIS